MVNRLYIDTITDTLEQSDYRGPSDSKVLTFMLLPAEEAASKAGLLARIGAELRALEQEFPEHSHQKGEDSDYNSARRQRVGPLRDQYSAIKGSVETYVVRSGQYNLGDVLDNVPTGAVPAAEFFKTSRV